jgi:hypothetical protein
MLSYKDGNIMIVIGHDSWRLVSAAAGGNQDARFLALG